MGESLKILKTQGEKRGVQFWAYCLMANHVHFIAIPKFPGGWDQTYTSDNSETNEIISLTFQKLEWRGWQGNVLVPLPDSFRA